LRYQIKQSNETYRYCKGSDLPIQSWTKVCATQDGDFMNLYENNNLICSKEMDNLNLKNQPMSSSDCTNIGNLETTCSILIGEWYDDTKFYFTGLMDNLYIYDYVLFDLNDLPFHTLVPTIIPTKNPTEDPTQITALLLLKHKVTYINSRFF
jgi:hypothetical protein